MKSMNISNISNISNIVIRLGLIVALSFSAIISQPVQAQSERAWTTVGSAGVVEEGHVDLVNLSGGGVAQLQAGAPANTSALIRYNVTATSGLFGALGTPIKMNVRYQDNNSNARVIVRLREYNFIAGTAPATIIEFDSNDYAAAAGLQTKGKNAACGFAFDFANKAYYLEVELSRTAANGFPQAAVVQLSAMPGSCV
ncbi:MAG: hypothetical protein ACKV2V_00110 [Blastocatellia bacterium]